MCRVFVNRVLEKPIKKKNEKNEKKGLHFLKRYASIYKLTSIRQRQTNPGVAQLVAHLTGGQGVVSSSLATRTIGVSFGVLRFFIVNWKAEPIALAIGVDAKTRSGILDHTKASFPLDTYANVTDDIQRQTAQVMDTFMTDIFGKELTPWQSGESPAAAAST